MGDSASPLVQRRRLRTELKKARIEKGLTQQQTATALDWSLSKIIRIERPSTSIKTTDLRALLQLYEITDAERVEDLERVAREARGRPWWHEYRELASRELLELIEAEYLASTIRQFETRVIPGILQTEEYARSILQYYYEGGIPAAQMSALVKLRVRRKELLDLEDAPAFHFILDEAAVQRVVGGEAVMREQLRRLIRATESPNIRIEVIPFSAGFGSGMQDPFELVEFAEDDAEDIVFSERSPGDNISDSKDLVQEYRRKFERLSKVTLDETATVAHLNKLADDLAPHGGGK